MVSTARSETIELLEAYRQFRDMQARDRLVVNYIPLVRRLSNRYRGAIEPPEDLFQVGMIGLLNTIEKFDPSYGTSFSSLAIPEVRGAILNHLRDHGSLIPNPPKDTDGRREDSGRGWVRELQGRWPGVLG